MLEGGIAFGRDVQVDLFLGAFDDFNGLLPDWGRGEIGFGLVQGLRQRRFVELLAWVVDDLEH